MSDSDAQPVQPVSPLERRWPPLACVFCDIVAGIEPARVVHRDDDVMVFWNVLGWVPVMLLAVPTRHMTQNQMWRDVARVAQIAVEVGERHCPHGFRLVSNFSYDGQQSQEHAHIHILGGEHLGPYVNPYRGR